MMVIPARLAADMPLSRVAISVGPASSKSSAMALIAALMNRSDSARGRI